MSPTPGQGLKPWTHYRARLAYAVQHGQHEKAEQARRDMNAARREALVAQAITANTPLTADQVERLTALLSAATAGGDV
ncbi:hypothetical protein ACIBSS_17565 [Micromonospora aurantiaca]|uniref:hypothetical protein n=1 Tax=Micromonospora aurantiaca (nom. illeg.) TaxID=47850 RepID=UPI0037ACE6AF